MPLLRETDEHFLAAAPTRFVGSWEIDRPAPAVWAELTNETPLGWTRALDIGWTSPRPFGVGTTRRAKVLGGALVVDEKYFIWEEGRRKAFCVVEANLPVFSRLAEDYVVEPLGEDRCRLTWTIAMEPKGVGKAGGPANALLVKSLFADTREHFATPRTPDEQAIVRSIQVVAWVRIVYGLLALFAPRFTARFFRLSPENIDARAWNAFLGSRDIALGIHHLAAAKDPARQGDVILLSQGCEVFDTMVVGQEIRQGRPFGFFTFAAIVFNAGMHAIWLNVHRLRRRAGATPPPVAR